MLYRLYTENKPGAESIVIDLLKRHGFRGATLYKGVGIWEGNNEDNLTIEIDTGGIDRGDINDLAEDIRQALNQEAVLVVKLPAERFLVTK
jgi:ribosomal protein S28E/S33